MSIAVQHRHDVVGADGVGDADVEAVAGELVAEQASIIRRYIIWRNRNAHDRALRELVNRANVA